METPCRVVRGAQEACGAGTSSGRLEWGGARAGGARLPALTGKRAPRAHTLLERCALLVGGAPVCVECIIEATGDSAQCLKGIIPSQQWQIRVVCGTRGNVTGIPQLSHATAGQPFTALDIAAAFLRQYYNVLNQNADELFRFYAADGVFSHGVQGEPIDSVSGTAVRITSSLLYATLL